jgi:ferredoxin
MAGQKAVAGKGCVACSECARLCPAGAVQAADGQTARVDENLCLGCGLCADNCPTGALRLEKREGQGRPPARVLTKIYIYGRILPSENKEMGQCRPVKMRIRAGDEKRRPAGKHGFSAKNADAIFGKAMPAQAERHIIGKAYTADIVLDNSNTRHHLGRFARRSKVVSQKAFMVDLSLRIQHAVTTTDLFFFTSTNCFIYI